MNRAAILALLAISFSPLAMAGSEGTGGGKGVVCRSASGEIESVELLDLWEAREVYGRPAVYSSSPLEEQLSAAIDRLKYAVQLGIDVKLYNQDGEFNEPDYFAFRLKKVSQFFTGDSRFVRRLRNARLTPTEDSFELAQPEGLCKIEQIVNFVDAAVFPMILIDQDLLDHMDATNRAALYLHEAFYLYMRGYHANLQFANYREPDSRRVRKAIGYVFAGNKFESLEVILKGKDYVGCSGKDKTGTNPSEFLAYEEADGTSRVLTIQLFGRPSIGYFPDEYEAAMPSEGVFPPTACKYKSREMGIGPSSYGVAGSGPIDFQSRYWIGHNCEKRKQVPYIQQDSSFRFAADPAQKLTCGLVKAKR